MPDLYDLYDPAHAAGRELYHLHGLGPVVSVLDLYCTDPARHLLTAGQDLDDLDRDLFGVCTIS